MPKKEQERLLNGGRRAGRENNRTTMTMKSAKSKSAKTESTPAARSDKPAAGRARGAGKARPAAPDSIDRRRNLALERNSEAYREMRRKIARAAAEVFNQKGFHGTTLEAVADALNMKRASLYYYVANKREMFDEVVREVSVDNVATAEAIYATDEPALTKLGLIIQALMDSYAAHYPLLYIFVREDLAQVDGSRSEWTREMRRLSRRYQEIVASIIQDGMDDGSIRPLISARVMAYAITGMMQWTSRWFVPQTSPEPAAAIGAAFAEFAIAGLRRVNRP
jgi:AcrR family transcriptional regulator